HRRDGRERGLGVGVLSATAHGPRLLVAGTPGARRGDARRAARTTGPTRKTLSKTVAGRDYARARAGVDRAVERELSPTVSSVKACCVDGQTRAPWLEYAPCCRDADSCSSRLQSWRGPARGSSASPLRKSATSIRIAGARN